MKKIFASIAMVLVLGIMFAPAVLAIGPGSIPTPGDVGIQQQGPASVTGWVGVVLTVVKWFYTIIFIVAIAMILLSAFHFVTSKGDAAKTKTAKSELLYAIIGIAVALLSYGIVSFVQNSVTSQLTY
ncbi:MAG: hypothetical protein WC099_03345 [Candidatus Paceibacterota bacterium]